MQLDKCYFLMAWKWNNCTAHWADGADKAPLRLWCSYFMLSKSPINIILKHHSRSFNYHQTAIFSTIPCSGCFFFSHSSESVVATATILWVLSDLLETWASSSVCQPVNLESAPSCSVLLLGSESIFRNLPVLKIKHILNVCLIGYNIQQCFMTFQDIFKVQYHKQQICLRGFAVILQQRTRHILRPFNSNKEEAL